MLRKIIVIALVWLTMANTVSLIADAETFAIEGNRDIIVDIRPGQSADLTTNISDEDDYGLLNNRTWEKFQAAYPDEGKKSIALELPSVATLNTTKATISSVTVFPSDKFASGIQRLIVRLPIQIENISSLRLDIHRIYNPSFFNISATSSAVTQAPETYPQLVFSYDSTTDASDNVGLVQNHTVSKGNSSFTYWFEYLEINCPIYTDIPYSFSLRVTTFSYDSVQLHLTPTDSGEDSLFKTVIIDHDNGDAWSSIAADVFTDFMGVYGMSDGMGGLILEEGSWLNFSVRTHALTSGDYITFNMPFTDQVSEAGDANTNTPEMNITFSDSSGAWKRYLQNKNFNTIVNSVAAHTPKRNTTNILYIPNATQHDATASMWLRNNGSTAIYARLRVRLSNGLYFIIANSAITLGHYPGSYAKIDIFTGLTLYQAGTTIPSLHTSATVSWYEIILQNNATTNWLEIDSFSTGTTFLDYVGCRAANTFGLTPRFEVDGKLERRNNFVLISEQYTGAWNDIWKISIHITRGNNTVWLYDFAHSNINYGITYMTNHTCEYRLPGENRHFWFRPWCSIQETNGTWVNTDVPAEVVVKYYYITKFVNTTLNAEQVYLIVTGEGINGADIGEFDNQTIRALVDAAVFGPARVARDVANFAWGLVKDSPIGEALTAGWDILVGTINAFLDFGQWLWDAVAGVAGFLWKTATSVYEFIVDNIPAIVSALMIISRVIFILVMFMAVWVVRSGIVKLCNFFNIMSTRGLRPAIEYGASIKLSLSPISGGLEKFGKVVKGLK